MNRDTCNSCVKPFKGKYLHSCSICGHPNHDKFDCTVGTPLHTPYIEGYQAPNGEIIPEGKQRNCRCPEDVDKYF